MALFLKAANSYQIDSVSATEYVQLLSFHPQSAIDHRQSGGESK
jgi:hypothetical protein